MFIRNYSDGYKLRSIEATKTRIVKNKSNQETYFAEMPNGAWQVITPAGAINNFTTKSEALSFIEANR
jgi:hypothetical protein